MDINGKFGELNVELLFYGFIRNGKIDDMYDYDYNNIINLFLEYHIKQVSIWYVIFSSICIKWFVIFVC